MVKIKCKFTVFNNEKVIIAIIWNSKINVIMWLVLEVGHDPWLLVGCEGEAEPGGAVGAQLGRGHGGEAGGHPVAQRNAHEEKVR